MNDELKQYLDDRLGALATKEDLAHLYRLVAEGAARRAGDDEMRGPCSEDIIW